MNSHLLFLSLTQSFALLSQLFEWNVVFFISSFVRIFVSFLFLLRRRRFGFCLVCVRLFLFSFFSPFVHFHRQINKSTSKHQQQWPCRAFVAIGGGRCRVCVRIYEVIVGQHSTCASMPCASVSPEVATFKFQRAPNYPLNYVQCVCQPSRHTKTHFERFKCAQVWWR